MNDQLCGGVELERCGRLRRADCAPCHAAEANIERGKKVRVDCTVVESNIHHPFDSTLLWDSVRVLVRLMSEANEQFGLVFHDRELIN